MENDVTNYDTFSLEYQWHSHEIIFGLLFEYLNKGELLLDLGIGTGLSSSYFKKLGLDIYGIDNSKEMLELCRKKGLTEGLILMDLAKDPFPFEDTYFDYVISSGVFHFIEDLKPIFIKTKKVLKNEGIFSFSVKYTSAPDLEIVECFYEDAGVKIYSHSDKYIEKLIKEYNLNLIKKQKFLGINNPSFDRGDYFTIYVLKK